MVATPSGSVTLKSKKIQGEVIIKDNNIKLTCFLTDNFTAEGICFNQILNPDVILFFQFFTFEFFKFVITFLILILFVMNSERSERKNKEGTNRIRI